MTHEQTVQTLYDLLTDPFANALGTLLGLSQVAPDKYRVGLEIVEPGVWSCAARHVESDGVAYSSSSTIPEQAVRGVARMWYNRLNRAHGI